MFSVPLSVALGRLAPACCAWPLASILPDGVRTFLQACTRRPSGPLQPPTLAVFRHQATIRHRPMDGRAGGGHAGNPMRPHPEEGLP